MEVVVLQYSEVYRKLYLYGIKGHRKEHIHDLFELRQTC